MALRIEGADVSCDATSCDVPLGGDFTVAIETAGPPSEGYIAVQTNLYYGGLIYNATASGEDENVWPDNNLPVRFPSEPDAEARAAAHGGLTSIASPFTVSTFAGDLVVLSMSCTSENQTYTIALLAHEAGTNPLGSTYSLEDQTTVSVQVQSRMLLDPNNQGEVQELPVADAINVNCGAGGDGPDILTPLPPGNGNGPPPPPGEETLPPPEATEAAEATAESLATAAVEATAAAATSVALGTPPADGSTTLGGTPTDGDDVLGFLDDDDGDSNTVLWIIIAIVVIAVLAVAGVLGWRYWQARQEQSDSAE